jgi:hypothetical protein
VTGGRLYLFVTPDASRPGNAASKLWRMGYRFHSRQKTYSIGPYGNGKDGTFSLADARRERDKAKDLLKEGKDPSTEKQLDKHLSLSETKSGRIGDAIHPGLAPAEYGPTVSMGRVTGESLFKDKCVRV